MGRASLTPLPLAAILSPVTCYESAAQWKVCGMVSDNLVPANARRGLYIRWAVIGLIPILLGLGASIALAGGQKPEFTPREQARMDDIGAGLLALSALVFLGGFWFDGLWTFEPRLRRHCRDVAAEGADRQAIMRARAAVAIAWLSKGALTLLLVGTAIPALAALHARLSGSLTVAEQILLMAALYQGFLLSQYPRYLDAVAFVADPRNDPPESAENPTAQTV